ncbi:MAG: peptidoglycan DD-metalloendopeptidase family protein, partial [Bacteroidia bacterium]
MRRAAGTLNQFDAATRRSSAAAGSYRMGMQQLGFQVNDVATQLASGTRIATVFAQQSGQIIQSIQLMSSSAGGFASFMAGPWGVAMTAGAIVLLPMIARMFDTRTELEKATEAAADNARKADLNRLAQEAYARTLPGVIDAIRTQTEALRQQNQTAEQSEQIAIRLAAGNEERIRGWRNIAVQTIPVLIQAAQAQAEANRSLTGDALLAGIARLGELTQQLRAAQSAVESLQRLNAAAGSNSRGADAAQISREVAESNDRLAQEAGNLRRAEAALLQTYQAGTIDRNHYRAQLDTLRDASRARVEQIQREIEAQRRLNHETDRSLTRPVTGALMSPYGADRSGVPLNGRLIAGRRHEGVDLRGNMGDPVVAPEGGTAFVRNAPGGLGLYVEIRADSGARDLLAHLSGANIRSGDRVTAGQLVGAVGNSGNAARGPTHLHWQRQVNGQWVDPMRSVGASGAAQSANAAQSAAEQAARRAAEVAERRQRDEENFQQQLAASSADILNARRRQVQSEEDQVADDIAAIRAEQAERDTRIRNETAARIRRDATQAVTASVEAGILLAASQELAQTKISARQALSQQRLGEQRIEIAQRDLNDQESVLQARGQLARTAMERRDIELRLLALQHQEEILAIEKQRTQQGLNAAQRAQLDRQEAASNARYALGQQNVMRQTAGPLEAFLSAIPRTAAEMNEALQSVAANGLQAITDGLTAVITGTESMGKAFKRIANQIISDLLRIALQRAIVGALGNALGGLFGGGAAAGSNAGTQSLLFAGARAAGGPVLPG